MAKKYRYRRYRKSGVWASNISEINHESITATAGTFSNTATLITNPAQTSTTTSQKYTIKNVDLQYMIESSQASNLNSLNVYVMYVPQGMNVDENYNIHHPEYIMAHKMISDPQSTSNQYIPPLRIKTRLARTLNTGDSIILYIKGYNGYGQDLTYYLDATVRWVSKAN